ncbi:hypothetical protein BSLG_005996 [Batrachochytrium salamandrivorans]|nr:hypothetical protein BSLG_005996 [Batrachochytrium salamandrivorans]
MAQLWGGKNWSTITVYAFNTLVNPLNLLGRFTGETDPEWWHLNASIHFDRRLWRVDIQGSQAYCSSLCRQNLLTENECISPESGLQQIAVEWENKSFKILDSDEDIHTANERRLAEIVGSVAGKLHTGRNRNDWLQPICACGFETRLLNCWLNPFDGHSLSLSHAWTWHADAQRLVQLIPRINQMPLGSGALAGNPFNIDRMALAADLKFVAPMPNSLYGVNQRRKNGNSLTNDMLATDLAEYLVPFRETHHVADMQEDVAQVWNNERSIEQRSALGGTSRKSVLVQIQELRNYLDSTKA